MTATIALLVFIVISGGVFAVGVALDQRSAHARLLRERLEAVQKPGQRQPDDKLALLRDELLSNIPAIDQLLRRSARISSLQKLLSQAKIKARAGNFLLLSGIVGLLFAVLMLLWAQNPLLAWLAFFVGFGVPYGYAAHRRRKRFERFEELFPHAIDTLARAVRAGHAFTTAIELIANEVSDPVAGEFRTLFEEQKFGLPVREALVNLTERLPLVDVKFFVTAVMLQRETGGNLAEILDNLSYVIRERFKILRQVRVFTAQGRMTMMVLMGLPPLFVLILRVMNPSFIQPLFAEPLGHILLVIGVTLQTIGYFVIRRVIAIQV